MELDELQRSWDEWGRRDPLWVILTTPEKEHGKWDPAEFFATGEADVARLFARLEELGLELPRRHRALDFGCGVGRLTQALCAHFDECVGTDIAPSMIESARTYNRFGDRCTYLVNATSDLRQFESDHFDLVYCKLVLQHIEPEHSRRYISEFVRVLAPGGLLVFQIPSELVSGFEIAEPAPSARGGRWRGLRPFRKGTKPVEPGEQVPNAVMNGIPRDEVVSLLEQSRAKPLQIKEDGEAGKEWRSYTYYVTKDST